MSNTPHHIFAPAVLSSSIFEPEQEDAITDALKAIAEATSADFCWIARDFYVTTPDTPELLVPSAHLSIWQARAGEISPVTPSHSAQVRAAIGELLVSLNDTTFLIGSMELILHLVRQGKFGAAVDSTYLSLCSFGSGVHLLHPEYVPAWLEKTAAKTTLPVTDLLHHFCKTRPYDKAGLACVVFPDGNSAHERLEQIEILLQKREPVMTAFSHALSDLEEPITSSLDITDQEILPL